MASNQTDRFQSLDSSVEEFIDGQENKNTKKKIKHDVALFHEFLVLKGETRQNCHLKSRVFTSVFQTLNFHRTISIYYQHALIYSK